MVVRGAPAQVCPICGEAYINEKITAELLKGAEVEIRQYVAAEEATG
jgi:hypothetical protein